MTVVRRLVPVLAVSGLAAAAPVIAANAPVVGKRPPRPCPPRGQDVIAEDTAMRVYRPKAGAANRNALPVVACLLDNRTRMTLVAMPSPAADPRRRHPGYLERIAIQRDIAAYVVGRRTGVDTGGATLTIADVAHRIVLREAPAGSSVDAGLVFSSGITALDVAPDGSAAWIVQRSRSPRSRSPEAEVLAAARKGPIEVLDDGPKIEPKSLYLSDQTVNWVDNGITRTAPLPSLPSALH